jgi:hypothetical protein
VRLYENSSVCASTVTDSAGLFSLSVPYRPRMRYYLQAGHTGHDDERGRGISILPDSVNRQSDIYLWPEYYLDTAAFLKLSTTHSVTLGSRRNDSLKHDSTLYEVYHNYLRGEHPLVLRLDIRRPDTLLLLGRARPREFTEDGRYLLTGVSRCQYMEIKSFGTWQTGMRLWDVDSIQLGANWPKSTFRVCPGGVPGSWDWRFGLCLRVYLAKRGPVYVACR